MNELDGIDEKELTYHISDSLKLSLANAMDFKGPSNTNQHGALHLTCHISHIGSRATDTPNDEPNANMPVGRTRELTFVRDFIRKTLFIMENDLWSDVEWETAILRLLKVHKLNSLLSSIIQLHTNESDALGDYLIRAVCYRYQSGYSDGDLGLLLRCGCIPSKETILRAYKCRDVFKIQYLLLYSTISVWDSQDPFQIDKAAIKGYSAFLEAVALSVQSQGGIDGPLKANRFLELRNSVHRHLGRSMVLRYPTLGPSRWFGMPPHDPPTAEFLQNAIFNKHDCIIGIMSEVKSLIKGNDGYLLYAIAKKDELTVRWLLDAGADPNVLSFFLGSSGLPDNRRYSITPLATAMRIGLTDIIERLLQAGADPNLPVNLLLYRDAICKNGRIFEFGDRGCIHSLLDHRDNISPLELAIIEKCGRDILELLWVAGARFCSPKVGWMLLLVYTSIRSPEFNFVAYALLHTTPRPHMDSNPVMLSTVSKSSPFHFTRDSPNRTGLAELRHVCFTREGKIWTLSVEIYIPAYIHSPPITISNSYSRIEFESMIHYGIRKSLNSDSVCLWVLLHNLVTIGDRDTFQDAFQILEECLAKPEYYYPRFKRYKYCPQAVAIVEYMMGISGPKFCGPFFRGFLLLNIFGFAWRGKFDKFTLRGYVEYLAGFEGTHPRANISSIYKTLWGNRYAPVNIATIFYNFVGFHSEIFRGEFDENTFQTVDYLIEIGWDVDEKDFNHGSTVLAVMLIECAPSEGTYAMVKKLCDAGASTCMPSNYNGCGLSSAVQARCDVFKSTFDEQYCWALQTIELLLQVERERCGHQHSFVKGLGERCSKGLASSLRIAVNRGDVKLVALFINAGIDFDELFTVAGRLVEPGMLLEVELWMLLEVESGTPLEVAVKKGRKDMVVLLLKAGAHITEKARQHAFSRPHILNLLSSYALPRRAADGVDVLQSSQVYGGYVGVSNFY
ncbi:hypothetical protein TWF730_003168 [Orbilia blumenaviensis]|uniref:Ankyrin n=1 Tax=Orbilia blumenaviensis TaxID=1796055 RepID=A0AAV9U5D3_9PEZI